MMNEDQETTENMGSPHRRLVEAMLFASPEPMTEAALAQHLGQGTDVVALLEELRADYATRGVHLVNIDGCWSFRTAPDLAPHMKITRQTRRKLPRAAAEVLAIIAYHQPITRGEIESIRGVETTRGTLDILLELGWVQPGKRRETPGRPLTWKTTQEFLSHFNLENLKDLPGLDELKAAGLLDARPVLSSMPNPSNTEDDVYALQEDSAPDDHEYAALIEELEPTETLASAS